MSIQANEVTNFCPAAFPVLPNEILDEAVPGNIRRAEHFTAFLARFVEYLMVLFDRRWAGCDSLLIPRDPTAQTRMRVLHVVAETPLSFLQHLKDITFIERKPLKSVQICATRFLIVSLTIALRYSQILFRALGLVGAHA